MTPEAEFNQLFTRMYELCEEQEWGDPFSYARSREIHMANRLGAMPVLEALLASWNRVLKSSAIGITIRYLYREFLRTEVLDRLAQSRLGTPKREWKQDRLPLVLHTPRTHYRTQQL